MAYFIIHYDEIGIKKGNRAMFEGVLLDNIRRSVKVKEARREYGQMIIETDDDPEKVKERLSMMPGIANFSLAEKTRLNVEAINAKALEMMKDKEGTFRITPKRHNKSFKPETNELSAVVGAYVADNTGLKVKLKGADNDLIIELCDRDAYLALGRTAGIGGLPVGSGGKVLCLISGGIDSPVASFMMMKRGMKVEFIHFQNKTHLTDAVKDKIEKLVKALSGFQQGGKLHIIPFDKIQKEIIKNVKADLRMLIYRRLMFMIAERIAGREKIRALVTGDSMAQVASQTLPNMEAVYSSTGKLVLTPLVGLNKNEIVGLAKKIRTYDISILPYGDCCSYFVAEHPETNASVEALEKAEAVIDKERLIDEAVKDERIVRF